MRLLLFFGAAPMAFVLAWQCYPRPFMTIGFAVVGLLSLAEAIRKR